MNNEYHNHSGGAIGADSQFDIIGREFGVMNHHHYWYGKPNPKSNLEDKISEEEYLEGVEKIYEANKTLKRKNIEKYMYLLARNWIQVKNSECIYAIGIIKKKQVSGGTGWAIQMAIDNNKPVYVYCQLKKKWFFWNNGFEVCVTPKLSKHFAGIGSRKITEDGIQAIKNLYLKTFDQKK